MLLTALLVCQMIPISAQVQKISGKVIDSEGGIMPGVAVTIQGSTKGTVTDINGDYSISADKGDVLRYSFIGCKPVERKVGSAAIINVVLEYDAIALDDVVMVGYGTQQRSHFAGAVTSLDPDEERLDDVPADGLDRLLQGRLAGVMIMDTEGQVGMDSEVRVRGNASFSANSSPLIVVDGLAIEGSLNDINVADIQNIEVLKDAASTAIYGSRGANGVIMVTTKQGTDQKTQFKVKYQAGVTNVLKFYDTYTLEDYAYRWYRTNVLYPWETGYLSAGQEVPASGVKEDGTFDTAPNKKAFLPYDKFLSTELNEKGTVYNATGAGYAQLLKMNEIYFAPDPQESITQTGMSHKATVSASGGSQKVKYYVSAAYNSETGVMINNYSHNFSMTANLNAQVTDRLKIDVKLAPRYKQYRLSTGTQLGGALRWLAHPLYLDEGSLLATNGKKSTPTGATVGTPAKSRDFRNMWLMNDDFTEYVLDPKGKQITVSTYSGTGDVTSYAIAEDTKDLRAQYALNGNFGLTFDIADGLVFRSTLGVSANVGTKDYWVGAYTTSKGASLSGKGTATYTNTITSKLVNENYLTYEKKLLNHRFNAMVGFSCESLKYETLAAKGQNYPNDYIQTLNYAGEIVATGTTNNKQEEALVSIFTRLGYDYKGKYIVQGTFRRDGSSQFGANRRWGNFPSASAAWRVSKEPWMRSTKTWLSDLKLRASWGISGNNSISRYSYVTGVSKVSYTLDAAQSTGYAPSSTTLGSANIGWEETEALNLGISAGFFKNRVKLNVDWYDNKTKALLLKDPIMNITGYQNEWMNVGQMSNKGLEIELTSVNIAKKNFEWSTTAVFSTSNSLLLSYGDTDLQYFNGYQSSQYRLKAGCPVGELYGYKTNGEIWKSAAEIEAGVEAGQCAATTTVGELKFLDITGDNKVTEDDKTGLGSTIPKAEWGLTNTFRFKGLDFSFMVQGSHGAKIWNMTNIYGGNYLRWMQEDIYIDEFHGNTPMTGKNSLSECDYLVEDASYVALRSLNLGYTIPKTQLRFYLSGRNLLYWMADGYHGINPEFRAVANSSCKFTNAEQRMTVVPLMRSINVGVDFTF